MVLLPEGPFGLPDVAEMEEAFNFPHQTPLVSCRTKSRTKASHMDTPGNEIWVYHEKETCSGCAGGVRCTGVEDVPFLKKVR